MAVCACGIAGGLADAEVAGGGQKDKSLQLFKISNSLKASCKQIVEITELLISLMSKSTKTQALTKNIRTVASGFLFAIKKLKKIQ